MFHCLNYTPGEGVSGVEPGVTPAPDTQIVFETWTDFEDNKKRNPQSGVDEDI